MHYPFLRKISLAHPILSPALAISLSLISAPSWADTIPLSMNDPTLQAESAYFRDRTRHPSACHAAHSQWRVRDGAY